MGKKKKETHRETRVHGVDRKHSRIPKIIHQVWLDFGDDTGRKSPPSKVEKNSDRICRFHPDWEYKLWRDKDAQKLVSRYYGWIQQFWDSVPKPVIRVDILRLLLMHHFGGIYLDMDVIVERPFLNDILRDYNDKDMLFVKTIVLGSRIVKANNYFLASTPNRDFWLYCCVESMTRFHTRSIPKKTHTTIPTREREKSQKRKKKEKEEEKKKDSMYTESQNKVSNMANEFFYVLWLSGPRMISDQISKYKLARDSSVGFIPYYKFGSVLQRAHRKLLERKKPRQNNNIVDTVNRKQTIDRNPFQAYVIHEFSVDWLRDKQVLKRNITPAVIMMLVFLGILFVISFRLRGYRRRHWSRPYGRRRRRRGYHGSHRHHHHHHHRGYHHGHH